MRLVPPLAAAVLAVAAVFASAPAAAAAPAATHYVALGDSYSSGVGTGSYDPSSGNCKRSSHAYPALWAASRAPASFAFVACSGARTGDVLANQVGALSASTTLVSISIGGNDAGFVDVITTCTLGTDQDCVNRTNTAKSYAQNTLPALLDDVYSTIRGRAPSAKVVVLGYPRMYQVPGSCAVGMSNTKRSAINSSADVLAQVVAQRAAARSFTFQDVRTAFTGHEICSPSWWLNSLSWPVEESYHPNRAGQANGYLPLFAAAAG
ncbi:SGNH/GDSL hydrolase family protein [Umezawaea beigongshangensis]|uniref:SGNH/GDSL hydrolase family protein n=1 Tax=Umezawaea beigongshangensis TaxID=2780383 RepID=UPI0018F19FDA|nr:SGNH/GDSL hydrolase family protein [Umezawaea beigongshangensis]